MELDKPIELFGSSAGECTIEVDDEPALSSTASVAWVHDLTLRQVCKPPCACVYVEGGSLTLEACRISSGGAGAESSAAAILARECTFEHVYGSGVGLYHAHAWIDACTPRRRSWRLV